jgi:DNA (cytosine-5)-methyltransferase 1
MFPDFVRAVRDVAPRAFLIENVKGLLRKSFRAYFDYILLQLSLPTVSRRKGERWQQHRGRLATACARGHGGLTYDVSHRLLNAADHGVPQTRQRVFIVGFRSDLRADWRFPSPTHSKDALLKAQWVTGEYWARHGVEPPRTGFKLTRATRERLAVEQLFELKPWQTIRDAIKDLPEPREDVDSPGVMNHRLNPGARSYIGHTGSPLDMPSKTLKAGVHGVPGGENTIAFPDGTLRYMTVREAARVQTFPDTWRFEGAWSEAMRQLGNAVPMRLGRVIAASIAGVLESRTARDHRRIQPARLRQPDAACSR